MEIGSIQALSSRGGAVRISNEVEERTVAAARGAIRAFEPAPSIAGRVSRQPSNGENALADAFAAWRS